MSQIVIANLTFGYDGSPENVFENLSLRIDTDWRLGIVGANGCGKTTLLRLLAGSLNYRGSVSSPGVRTELFPQPIENPSEMSADMIAAALPDIEKWRVMRELSLLGVSEDSVYLPLDCISPGERVKIRLAMLFLKENLGNGEVFPLIDEPTNHLDAVGRAKVAAYLAAKRGFIVVSHDREFLDLVTDHTMSINRDKTVSIESGGYSVWHENKLRRDACGITENDKLEREISRLRESERRTSEWANYAERSKIGSLPRGCEVENKRARRAYEGEKSRKLMSRAMNFKDRQEKAIEQKSALLRNIEQSEPLKLSPLVYPKKTLVTARELTLSYDGRVITPELTFSIESGDRAAVVGGNGSGKSSLIKAVLSASGVPTGAPVDTPEHSGLLNIGGGMKISYVGQDTSTLRGHLSELAEERTIDKSLLFAILRKLGFPRSAFERDISEYSEGQKKKTLIAASLCDRAHLYIWDEPLNFIDVLSREQIEALILTYRPTMIFVEHDARFVKKTATKEIIL